MKKAALCLAAAMVCSFAFTSGAAARNANVTVHNDSKWEIHNFFLAPSESDEWGPDQLGDEIVENGGKFTLNQIPCDTYDVKLVDEDGDECVVTEVDICGGSDDWVVTDEDLLECEGY